MYPTMRRRSGRSRAMPGATPQGVAHCIRITAGQTPMVPAIRCRSSARIAAASMIAPIASMRMLGGERRSSMMVGDGRRWLAMRCDARRCMERWAPSERRTERTTRGERRTSRRARALPRSWSRRDRERARWSEPSEPMRQASGKAWRRSRERCARLAAGHGHIPFADGFLPFGTFSTNTTSPQVAALNRGRLRRSWR